MHVTSVAQTGAVDAEHGHAAYDVSFDWRRYRRVVGSGGGLTAVARAHLLTGLGQRVHRIRHTATKVVGLPDHEFEKMLRRAVELWGEYLAPGDRTFSLEECLRMAAWVLGRAH